MQVYCVFSPSDHCQGKIAGYEMNLFSHPQEYNFGSTSPMPLSILLYQERRMANESASLAVLDSLTEKPEVFCYSAWTLIDRHESINHSTQPYQVKADI